ncbi:kinase-like domain-containing protein [Mycena crocata]|nr:kinase-like domain-containing protein [Mycena crocata]
MSGVEHDDPSSSDPPEGPRSYLYCGDEEWWVMNYPFLLSQGYKLRRRYEPNWVPSWWKPEDNTEEHEDELQTHWRTPALDAIRVSTGEKVVLKRVLTRGGKDDVELRIATRLSNPRLRSDPHNHTIPILEVIELPDERWSLLVMPYCRRFDDPPFHCPAEFVEAMQQYLEGLQFMHDHNICHLDISPKNMMMDETLVVPAGSHFMMPRTHSGFPKLFRSNNRCAVGPVNYYYIDFGLSLYFPNGQATALTSDGLRNFEMIPEMSGTKPYNPFKVDIFQLGLVMQKLIQTYAPLRHFAPVAAAMMAPNPQGRPAPRESLIHLKSIAAKMSSRAMDAPMWKKKHFFDHVTRRLLGGYFPNTPYLLGPAS